MNDNRDGYLIALAQKAWRPHAHDNVLAHQHAVDGGARFGIERDGVHRGPPGSERIRKGQGKVSVAGGVGMYGRRPVGCIRKSLAYPRLHDVIAWLHLG